MEKTVIIIPYRDRGSHLNYFLEHSYPMLKNLISNTEIIVVEQTEGKKFNRGATINIGYSYYNEPNNYYITQDVDTNPNENSLPYYSQKLNQDEFLSIYSYSGSVGGICKFKGKDFVDVNGFPNNIWGWGNEDRDFMNRILFFNKTITRVFKTDNTNIYNKHFNVFHDNHKREHSDDYRSETHRFVYNTWNNLSTDEQNKYIFSNGLNNLRYSIIEEKQIMENVKKITVDI